MEAFESVRKVAAKPVVNTGGRTWNEWQLQQANHSKRARPDEDESGLETRTEVHADLGESQIRSRSPKPDAPVHDCSHGEGEAETSESEKRAAPPAASTNCQTLPPRPAMTDRKWQRGRNPLTRRPRWRCAELDLESSVEPLPAPWRPELNPELRSGTSAAGVGDAPAFYWWNPETNETRWS